MTTITCSFRKKINTLKISSSENFSIFHDHHHHYQYHHHRHHHDEITVWCGSNTSFDLSVCVLFLAFLVSCNQTSSQKVFRRNSGFQIRNSKTVQTLLHLYIDDQKTILCELTSRFNGFCQTDIESFCLLIKRALWSTIFIDYSNRRKLKSCSTMATAFMQFCIHRELILGSRLPAWDCQYDEY